MIIEKGQPAGTPNLMSNTLFDDSKTQLGASDGQEAIEVLMSKIAELEEKTKNMGGVKKIYRFSLTTNASYNASNYANNYDFTMTWEQLGFENTPTDLSKLALSHFSYCTGNGGNPWAYAKIVDSGVYIRGYNYVAAKQSGTFSVEITEYN